MTQSNSSSNSLQSLETDSKLVSIICRTVNRPELAQALASIAEQSYSNIEVVLVDALDQGIDLQLEDLCPNLPITLVSGLGKLPRSAAANAGLDNAKGDYLLFLDDDDWIAASHISNLVELLEGSSGVLAVYSSARKANAAGAMLEHVFSHAFDRALLRRDNFIPIHAVLFSAALLQRGCRFDESMDIYEDWDFWIQVSQHGDLLHHNGITAFYREGGDSTTAVDSERVKYRADHPNALAREKVLQKWLPSWSAADVNQMLGTMDQSATIAELKHNVDEAHELIRARDEEFTKLNKAVNKLEHANRQLNLTHHELTVRHEELDAGVRELLGSFSWRITKPLRFLGQRIKTHILTPIWGPLKKNTVKVVLKNSALHKVVRDVRANLPGAETQLTDKFHYGLDSPSEDHKIFSDKLSLRGWAMLESGAASLTSYIDDLEFRAFTPSQSRPDVDELFPWLGHASSSGFTEEISLQFLSSGAHSLRLVARSDAGFETEIRQDFYLLTDKELYSAWFDYQTQHVYGNDSGNAPAAAVVHILLSGGAEPAATLASIDSVLEQSYAHWRLHYLGADWLSIEELLSSEQRLALGDKLNVAPQLKSVVSDCDAPQDFLLGLAGGELLMPSALSELLSCAHSSASDVVYCDHDHITTFLAGAIEHTDPVFTFSWSPDQLLSQNYVGDVYLFSAACLDRVFLQSCSASSWRYAVLLELGQQSRSIQRLAKVLWSSSPIEEELAETRLLQEQATVEDYLNRHAPLAKVKTVDGVRSIDWALPVEPSVAIIIPTMGKLELIKPCLDSLVEKTRYKNYQVIMLDNSRGKFPVGINYLHEKHFEVIECDEAFNWARLNNIGAAASSADYLLFLNDDIEITESDWLHGLVKQAQRSDVGTVGGLLLYPNGAIQHAGVFMVNQGGGCAHLFHKMMPDERIYQNLHRTTREVSANTGACLLLAREKFEALNGFDEELAIVGNDIDLCLRLSAAGYRNIWTPQCSLIHHESISRKASVPKRDEEAMWKRWRGVFEAGDPYYNPNLALEKWDCSLRLNMPAANLIKQIELAGQDRQVKPPDSLLEGVNLIGYIRAEMGVGEGARSDARAFAAGGTEFGIINFETANPARMTDLSWQHKEMLSAPYDINLIHINADYLPLAKQELPAHFFQGRYNIAYWAWELEEIPEQWLASFDEVDEVWVPSEFVKQAMERNSPVPVVTIPHCVDVKPQYKFSRKDFTIPEHAFVFISMFDTHSLAERKNPYGAVKAFKQAFAGDNENVCLILKVNNTQGEELEKLRESIQSYPNILILDQTHSREQINALLQLSDCFVSLHRSEGFGLGPAEAMSLGKATILTNWSGSTDYMTEKNCKPIGYELITIKKAQGPYKAGQRWADPNIDEAAKAMVDLVNNPEMVAAIGDAAKTNIENHFSPAAVGKLVNARLKAIREARR